MGTMNLNTASKHESNSPQLARLLEYLASDPVNKSLAFRIIDVSLEENRLDLADQILEQTELHWPKDHGLSNRRAIVALRRNKPQTAICELERILAEGKAGAAVRYNLGYACYMNGDYTKARDALKPALSEADKVPALAPLYTLCLQQLGEFDAAIGYAEKRLRSSPDDAELQGVLALLYFDGQKDLDVCRRHTAMALQSQPQHPMALVTASSLALMDDKAQEAIDLGQRVIQHNPNDGRAWACIGMAYLHLRELQAAQQALERALQTLPVHIGTWHLLAWVQLLRDDVDGAESSLNKARELDRNAGETYGGLAIVAYMRGEKDRAKSNINRARRLAPANLGQHYLKLLQLQDSGDDDALKRYIQEMLERKTGRHADRIQAWDKRPKMTLPREFKDQIKINSH